MTQFKCCLTQKEAAEHLGVSVKWLQVCRRRGQLRYMKLGYRTIRYRLNDLLEFRLSKMKGSR